MAEFDFHLPTRNEVDKYKKTLLPKIEVENTKTFCHLPELITQTVLALTEGCTCSFIGGNVFHINSKFGIDGSGSHQIRHQLSGNEDDPHDLNSVSYIGAFWCPLELKYGSYTLWTNPVPNSTLFSRPVCLMRAKETRKCVEKNFKIFLDAAHQLESSSLQIEYNNIMYDLNSNIELSMVDGKMADILQGDSGSFRHYCNITRAEANDKVFTLKNRMKT